jgi:hypothetical protein
VASRVKALGLSISTLHKSELSGHLTHAVVVDVPLERVCEALDAELAENKDPS